jgi:hypothetical protein
MPKTALKTPRATTRKRSGGKRVKPAPKSRRTTAPTEQEIAAKMAVVKAMFNPAAAAAARKAFLARQRANHAG